MIQVNLAKAKSSFSEHASRAAYTNEHIIITKRGRPFVALISVNGLEMLEKIKEGTPEDGLSGAAGTASELEEVAEKAMEGYQKRADDIGRGVEVEI
ncbi:MAG: type II toxin-antitoxin system prevent-host-death family antitoxin [Desulfobacterales bacterium]